MSGTAFLEGGGEAARMIRARDWSAHPLGPPEGWSPELRAALSLVLNSPESMILAWGPELHFFFNDTYFPLLGPRLPRAMGERFDEVWADGWAQAKPIIDEALAGRGRRFVDLPWTLDIDRGRRDTWWTFSYSRVLDGEGRVAGLFIFTNETTDRVLADAALRESEALARENIERVQLALEAGAIIGTWFWDLPNDRFTVDQAFARSFGLDPALGREGIPLAQVVETVHPDDQAGLARAINDAVARGGRYAHQYRVRRRDGRYYWLEANGHVEHGADGTPLRFPGVLIDVEERRAAQEALRASEAHWRGLFERLSEGFLVGEVVRDAAGRIADWRYVEVNRAWGDLVGIAPAQVVGRTVREMLPGIEEAWVSEFADVVDTAEPVAFTRRVGSLRRWYEGRAFPLGGERFGVIFLDVTERIETEARRAALLVLGDRLQDLTSIPEMTRVASQIVGTTLDATRAGFGRLDAGVEFIEIEADWTAPGVGSIAGRHRFADYGSIRDDLARGEPLVIEDVRADPRTRDNPAPMLDLGIEALINMPVRDRGRTVAAFIVQDDHPRAWTPETLGFLRNVAERLEAGVARIRAEDEQRILNEELSHRLKNTFAMVLSIAGQTLRSVSDRAPVEAFESRIHALSSAHEVLLRQSWAAAPAKDVIKAVVTGAGHGDRIDVSGPDLDLGPRATLSLSLLLHELATNAAKYGALSVPGGRVAIDWRLEGGNEVTLDWTERGGPPPAPPANGGRKGFGSRLIRMGLVGTGGVDLRYPPSGFQATMRAPLVQLQQS